MNCWPGRFLEIIVILILWPTWPSSIPQDVECREARDRRAKARLFGRGKAEAESPERGRGYPSGSGRLALIVVCEIAA